MILGYLLWGDRGDCSMECAFSICSFLSRQEVDAVCVLTDRPELLGVFSCHPKVRVHTVPTSDFIGWYGEKRFIYRAKIKGLQKLVELNPGEDILFLDTDTFCAGDAMAIRKHLAQGGFCMHHSAGNMNDDKGFGEDRRVIWHNLKNREWNGIRIGDDARHWNSGCIGLPGGKAKEVMENVLMLNDAILAGLKDGESPKLSEEIAYSMILGASGEVMDVADIVGHYYANKAPWQNAIYRLFAECHAKGNSLEQDIEAVQNFDFWAIPIHSHIRRWRRRIDCYMKKLLPDKRIRYFPGMTSRR